MKEIVRASISGMTWSALGHVVVRGSQFLVGIFLARLLTPADFGLIGMLGIFLGISEMFVNCGFPLAFVRKTDRTEKDASTVFWFSLAMSLACYAVMVAAAPAIAAFFGEPSLAPIARVVSLGIVLGALATVPQALLRIRLRFAAQSVISVVSVAASGALGIFLALRGYGVWSLVWQGVLYGCLAFAFAAVAARWRPRLSFSAESFKEFFSFGWKHLLSSIVNAVYYHIYSLVAGKALGAASVGIYNRAHSWAALPPQALSEAMTNVNYPLLARFQNDNVALRRAYDTLVLASLVLLVPVLGLLAVFAEPIVGTILGEQWICCAPYIRILAVGLAFEPAMSLYQNMLYLKGRTDIVLKLEIVQKPACFALVFAGLPFGLAGLCVAKAASTVFMAFVNLVVARRLAR